MPIYVSGMGFYTPSERITNAQLARTLDTSAKWLDDHLGILERRRATDEETTARLGALALEHALASSFKRKEALDLLVCATSTPDMLVPSTACQIGQALGIDPVAFDLGAACSGFPYSIAVASAMLRSGEYQHCALVVAERYTRFVDYKDRNTCVFFGDSAGSVLLERKRPERGFEVLDQVLMNRNQGAPIVRTPVHGYFTQDGPKVKEAALQGFASVITSLLERNNLAVKDLAGFVGHQANLRVLEEVCRMFDVPETRHWHNVSEFGNQGGAGCVTALCQHVHSHRDELRDGDKVMVVTFGAGFTMGGVLLQWVQG